jgi:thiosulfate dehydrogenase
MNDPRYDFKTWAIGVIFLGLAGTIGYSLPHQTGATNTPPRASPPTQLPASNSPQGKPQPSSPPPSASAPGSGAGADARQSFTPPPDDQIPNNEFGKMVRFGRDVFEDTQNNAREYVGNALRCANCHIDGGRLAYSAPLWAAYVAFPTYRAKNGHVNTFQERMQGCFLYSMNGKEPPLNSKVLVGLESYAYFLAKGAPTGANLPGRGYPKLSRPQKFDYAYGQRVFAQKCALCHGPDGQGQSAADGTVVFPPLWGPRSYNWGAGMSSINNAAGFTKANMPLGQEYTLSDEEAWAVATYLDSQERPQDPRFNGSVAETRKADHDSPMDMYGQTVNGVVLGQNSPPSGPPNSQ